MIRTFGGLSLVLLAVVPLSTGAKAFSASDAAETSTAVATSARFHSLLARGDSAGAERLLAADAVVLESGDLETRAQYVAHHLGEDIEFAKVVPTTRTIVGSRRDGNVVWITATSASKGRFGERQIDSRGGELMILTRSGSRWLIRAIHWSSRRVQPGVSP